MAPTAISWLRVAVFRFKTERSELMERIPPNNTSSIIPARPGQLQKLQSPEKLLSTRFVDTSCLHVR